MPKQELLRHKQPIDATRFEAFYRESWHGVDLISIKDGTISVQLNYYGSVIEDTICGNHLRLRSRKACKLDCIHLLKSGSDVCVLSAQQVTENTDREPELPLLSWRDAKIISIKRAHHEGWCACLFSVLYDRNKTPTSMMSSSSDRGVETVTIDKIAILQKPRCEPYDDGFHHWTSSEDCFCSGRSKLLSGTLASDVSWLIVLSTLKGMHFNIKLVQNKIVYRVVNNARWSSTIADAQSDCDSHVVSPSFDERMKVVRFQRCNEALRLKFEIISPEVSEEMAVPDTVAEDLTDNMEDQESDVEILYDYMNLRRSKRPKIQPDRFMPNFRRFSATNVACNTNRSSSPEEELCQKMKPSNSGSSKHEESSSCPAAPPRTSSADKKAGDSFDQPVLVVEVDDICESPERNLQDGLKQRSSCGRVKDGLYSSSHKRRFPSSRIDESNCSGRKKLLSAYESEQLLKKCLGNLKCEVEDPSQPADEWTAAPQTNFLEEFQDFNWSSSAETQTEPEEYEDLWKEMEHSLNTLALLERKQKLDSDFSEGTTNTSNEGAEQPCQHDYKMNEQIGMTCRLCNLIGTEIRYISPPFFQNDGWLTYYKKWCSDAARWTGPNDSKSDPFRNVISSSDISSKVHGDIWASIPDLESKLHLHQKKAFEFIWRNIAGSLKPEKIRNQPKNTGGCVISHSPGAGKTLLVISFLISYLKLFPGCRPLILAPKIAVYIWCKEFEKWGVSVPVHVIHPAESYKKEMRDSSVKLPTVDDDRRPNLKVRHVMDCLVKLRQWHESPSVLLMSYSTFFSIVHRVSKVEHRRFMADILLKSPGVLVLDEGHNPRSTRSKLRKLLMKVNTELRILLSGTLFQNNFEEYFNTLCMARPTFVDDVARELDPNMVKILSSRNEKGMEKINRRERFTRRLFMEEIGQRIESSEQDERKEGFNLLNRITNRFIDVYEGERSDSLPGLHVYTVMLTSPDIQREILSKLHKSIKHKRCPLDLELLITVGSMHPWLIKTMASVVDYFTSDELENVEKYKKNYRSGSKMKFVIDLVHKSTVRGERVLVFCRNIAPINFLVDLFEIVFGWCRGEEVLVLQGDQELFERAKIMDKFNGDSRNKCRVLLASTSACAEGISLTAASRVVLLDSEWNHSKTRQAIARAFRPGQEKVVYVYRLLASGTWEEDKYHTNEWKAWLSKMIFVGKYIEFGSSKQVEDVEDEMLKELAEEDQRKTFQMIMKQD